MAETKAPKPLKSWDEVNTLVGEIGEKENQWASLQAEKDSKLLEIDREYSGMSDIKDEIKFMKERVQNFAESHRNEMEEQKKKSLSKGEIYFRNNPASVKLIENSELKPKELLNTVIKAIKKSKKWAESFLAVKTDIDKAAIKKAYEDEKIDTDGLAKLGLAIEQGEGFHIKPNP